MDESTRVDDRRHGDGCGCEICGFIDIMVTHDVAEAVAPADRVLMIEDGEITLDLRVGCPGRAGAALPMWRR